MKKHEKQNDYIQFNILRTLSEEEKLILESIRYRDQDLSQKLGAVLAFSGLMIAASTVQLSSSQDSILYIPPENIIAISNKIGILILFGSSFISLRGLTASSTYPNIKKQALIKFKKHVYLKLVLLRCSIFSIGIGSILILISFIYSLFWVI